MSTIYDNWERLVAATLKRDQIWQLCHAHSRETSISSLASDFSFSNSPLHFSSPTSSSFYHPNSILAVGPSRRGYVTDDFENSPEEIFVNGDPLSLGDLTLLLSCQHPPRKLKPGHYWYDNLSGFWGKLGQKPSQIISPHLKVGGRLNVRASNGNTQVYINGREITRVEQRMLKFAGVRCRPGTSFWVSEDGSYQLEGQKNISLRRIWDKAGMKLFCSVLSLPFPPKFSYKYDDESVPDYLEKNDIQKLLLIGCDGSGMSTVFKQAADIFKPYLKSSRMEVPSAEGSSSSLSFMDFSFPPTRDESINRLEKEPLPRYQLIRLPTKGFEVNYRLFQIFEEINIAIICISLTGYEQVILDRSGALVNRMMVDKKFFESVATHPLLRRINVLLLLTKYDLFEEKITQIPLHQCDWFNEFNPAIIGYGIDNLTSNLGQTGFHFISAKFKKLYTALTGRKLYVAPVNCLEQDSVDAALKYAREILKWDEESAYLSYISDESIYSDDDS